MALTYTPKDLIAGDFPVARDMAEIPISYTAGGLLEGTVLGMNSTDGTFRPSLAASNDGTQTPRAILLDNVADMSTLAISYSSVPVAFTGEFNEEALVIGTGHTADSIRAGLRDKNIYLKTLAGRS